jgi:hypothetical protein
VAKKAKKALCKPHDFGQHLAIARLILLGADYKTATTTIVDEFGGSERVRAANHARLYRNHLKNRDAYRDNIKLRYFYKITEAFWGAGTFELWRDLPGLLNWLRQPGVADELKAMRSPVRLRMSYTVDTPVLISRDGKRQPM